MISTDERDAPELRIDWGEAFKESIHPDIDHDFADFGIYTKPGNSKGVQICSCIYCGYIMPKNKLELKS